MNALSPVGFNIKNLPEEMFLRILRCLGPEDLKTARLVCRKWARTLYDEIPRALCLNPAPDAVTLDGSWGRRWRALSSYDPGGCLQTTIDLHSFLDGDLQFAPNSERSSFFRDEVILIDPIDNTIYRCNYLTRNKTKLVTPLIEGVIHQIYCHEDSLAILTTKAIIICDLTRGQVPVRCKENPSLAGYFAKSEIGYYDKKFFILVSEKMTVFIDLGNRTFVCEDRLLREVREDSAPQRFFTDGRIFVQRNNQSPGSLQGLNVRTIGQRTESWFQPPSGYFGRNAKQSILDGKSLAFCTYHDAGDGTNGTDFCLAETEYNPKPRSKLTVRQLFYLPERFKRTAIWASKRVCAVGLDDRLAIWNYRNNMTLVSCDTGIKHILVQNGKIIINPGKKFRLLDFTGTNLNPAESVTYKRIHGPSFLQRQVNKVLSVFRARYFRLMSDINYLGRARHPRAAIVALIALEMVRTGIRLGLAALISYLAYKTFKQLIQKISKSFITVG